MKGTEQSIPRRVFVQKDDMARLFPSQAGTYFPHSFQYIAVAYFGLLNFNFISFSHQEKAQITHNSRYNPVAFQLPLALHVIPYNGHNLVTVHNIAQFIHCKQPVGIPVKSQTYIRFLVYYPCLQFFHMRRAAIGIDIRSIRAVMNCHHFTAQFFQGFYRCIIRSTLRTVNHYFQTAQVHIYGLYRMVNIFFPCIRTVFYLSYAGTRREFHILHPVTDQSFNFIFQVIREFIAIPIKKLNPVELYRIMGSGNYHARVHLVLPRQISDSRRRKNPYINTIRPYGARPGH